jgi:hypothetical protein
MIIRRSRTASKKAPSDTERGIGARGVPLSIERELEVTWS